MDTLCLPGQGQGGESDSLPYRGEHRQKFLRYLREVFHKFGENLPPYSVSPDSPQGF